MWANLLITLGIILIVVGLYKLFHPRNYNPLKHTDYFAEDKDDNV